MPRPLLNQKWYNWLEDPEQAEELEKRFVENEDLFIILHKIIEQKIEANNKVRRKRNYEIPAWSELQADCNGYERALHEILTYLKTTKETR